MYAGTGGGVFVSEDYGSNWTEAIYNSGGLTSVAIIGNRVFAGSMPLEMVDSSCRLITEKTGLKSTMDYPTP